MAFDFWRFMASPHGSTSGGTGSYRRQKRRGTPTKAEKPRVPWFISVTFFVALLRVIAVTVLMLALSAAFDDPLPGWFNVLLLVYGAAMAAALVFVLNGFGWARLAWAVLAAAIICFVQDPVILWVIAFDLVVLLVLFLPPSNRYMTGCAEARRNRI